jgi:hypothetical protein
MSDRLSEIHVIVEESEAAGEIFCLIALGNARYLLAEMDWLRALNDSLAARILAQSASMAYPAPKRRSVGR